VCDDNPIKCSACETLLVYLRRTVLPYTLTESSHGQQFPLSRGKFCCHVEFWTLIYTQILFSKLSTRWHCIQQCMVINMITTVTTSVKLLQVHPHTHIPPANSCEVSCSPTPNHNSDKIQITRWTPPNNYYHWLILITVTDNLPLKVKLSSYVGRYRVLVTIQNGLHFIILGMPRCHFTNNLKEVIRPILLFKIEFAPKQLSWIPENSQHQDIPV